MLNENVGIQSETLPAFSVIIPIYNEEDNLYELYTRLTIVMENLCKSESIKQNAYEILLIDDGSKDTSWSIIKELNLKDRRIKGLSFSKNFGHHIAISAGIDHASGEAIILMDGDLQDPPEEIPKLYHKMKDGYDLVCGIRSQRADNFFRDIASHFFWFVFKTFIRLDIPKHQSMLRIMSRRFLDSFKRIEERNRFLAGLFSWTGFNQTTIPITHAPRFSGKSKYNLNKMLKLTFHAITSFSYFPLQLAGIAGLFIALLSFSFGMFLIIEKLFFHINVAGWASTMVAILFMGGVQLAFLGLIGEYLGRVFIEVQRRPLYFIKEQTSDEKS